jgi:hypothetical protein
MSDDSPSRGIVFPVGADGTRSTTRAGAAIVAAALAPLDAGHAQQALDERHWRRRYPLHFRRLVAGALAAPDAALASARAGLDAALATLRFADEAGERPLAELGPGDPGALHRVRMAGRGDPRPAPWRIPYRGALLEGDALRRRIDAWREAGVIEPSAAAALHRCAAHPEWFDLSDRTLVLLGAGSEAGPLRWLARWRANLVAVDIPRGATWRRIASVVDAGNATLHAPARQPVAADRSPDAWVDAVGADLLTETPAIAAWVRAFDGPLDVASIAYLDGERHVRVSLAMDRVAAAACEGRRDTSLAYMATPTDVFAVPADAARAAMVAYATRPLASRVLQTPLRRAGGEGFFQPNVEALVAGPAGREYGVVDSLVIEQGPNYALAKRLQQWRATLARAAGHRVSLSVAPSTTTASVVKNPALAAGFAGADLFGIEVFEPETTNAVMAAMWVHDLRSNEALPDPARPLAHPFELFMDGAVHGGLWRCAYRPRSALAFAAALGWVRRRVGAG